MLNEFHEIDFQKLVKYSTDLIQVVDPHGMVLYANLSWQRTLKYSFPDLVGHSIYEFIADDRRDDFRRFREDVIKNRQSNVFLQTAFISKTGEEINVEGFMSCEFDENRLQYTHAIFRDVSARMQQEKIAEDIHRVTAERQYQLEQLFENAPDAIIVIDDESKILLWNPKSEAIFGWSAHEVVGKLLGDTIIPPQYREMHYRGMKRFLATGEAQVLNKTIEITALKNNGTEFHIALTISRLLHKGVNQFIAFIRDISEQKQMEEDLKFQKQQLENTNKELTYFASMTTHDLKEPIRKIRTFSDLLTSSNALSATFSADELLAKIQDEANRMSLLVDSVANLSDIPLSNITIVPVNVNDVLNKVVENLHFLIDDKRASIITSALPSVRVSHVHLYHLMQNLLSNALKYSQPDLPPVINVSCQLKGDEAEFSFADNGLGFDEAYAEKIFQPFQRLHGKRFQGTGMGLAICKKIVESYGGRIKAESEKNKGTTIRFMLPV